MNTKTVYPNKELDTWRPVYLGRAAFNNQLDAPGQLILDERREV